MCAHERCIVCPSVDRVQPADAARIRTAAATAAAAQRHHDVLLPAAATALRRGREHFAKFVARCSLRFVSFADLCAATDRPPISSHYAAAPPLGNTCTFAQAISPLNAATMSIHRRANHRRTAAAKVLCVVLTVCALDSPFRYTNVHTYTDTTSRSIVDSRWRICRRLPRSPPLLLLPHRNDLSEITIVAFILSALFAEPTLQVRKLTTLSQLGSLKQTIAVFSIQGVRLAHMPLAPPPRALVAMVNVVLVAVSARSLAIASSILVFSHHRQPPTIWRRSVVIRFAFWFCFSSCMRMLTTTTDVCESRLQQACRWRRRRLPLPPNYTSNKYFRHSLCLYLYLVLVAAFGSESLFPKGTPDCITSTCTVSQESCALFRHVNLLNAVVHASLLSARAQTMVKKKQHKTKQNRTPQIASSDMTLHNRRERAKLRRHVATSAAAAAADGRSDVSRAAGAPSPNAIADSICACADVVCCCAAVVLPDIATWHVACCRQRYVDGPMFERND